MSPVSTILLSCAIAGVVAIRPGMRVRINPSGLQFVCQRVKYEVPKLARHRPLPDQEGDFSIYIGTVHYSVYGLYITDVMIGYMDIIPTFEGVKVSLSFLEVYVYGQWKDELNWLSVGDSGTVQVSVKRMRLSLLMEMGYDYMGRPTLHTDTSYCSFHDYYVSVSVKGSGTYDWIYERYKGTIEHMIMDKLNEQVCSVVAEEVNTKVAEKLRHLQVVHPITKYAEIDLRLISKPDPDYASITTNHKGTVYETASHREPPFNVSVIPYDRDRTRMVFVWITDYVANSACYVLHNTHFFQYLLTEDNIPAGVDLNLNTSSLQMTFLFPKLSKLYPKRLLQINMNTTAPPNVTFGVNNVSVIMEGDLAAYVVQQNRSLTYVFTLGATVKVRAELGAIMTNVTWDKTSISYDLKLLKSAIPDFKIKELKEKLTLALKMFIMPKVQQMGKVGIPLPSLPLTGYALRDLNISHGQNFLKIGTDIYYHGRLQEVLSETRSQLISTFTAFFEHLSSF